MVIEIGIENGEREIREAESLFKKVEFPSDGKRGRRKDCRFELVPKALFENSGNVERSGREAAFSRSFERNDLDEVLSRT
jgi:hypothetical protein